MKSKTSPFERKQYLCDLNVGKNCLKKQMTKIDTFALKFKIQA